ncbi:putative Zn(2)-C6 fungal-type domain-containing protein [Seiridium unicorne]|uniref:Zn(2)-C6 fungal-type domain-containing protein n=1 Tax=Seiridium unicorne TaxID=138068 RepID=A0ABR2VD73_9PEZI
MKCQILGAECLGYEKRLTWVGGTASRGPMSKKTFSKPVMPPYQVKSLTDSGTAQFRYVHRVVDRGTDSILLHDVSLDMLPLAGGPLPSMRKAPTQPFLQDLSRDARYLIDYCLVNAIMAVAACRLAHSMLGYPVFSYLEHQATVDDSMSQMTFYSVQYKQRALKYFVLLMLLEYFESGAGSWTTHLEGAKALFDAREKHSNTRPPQLFRNMVDEVVIFDIFGSTLVRPESLTHSIITRLPMGAGDDLTSLTCVGCPMEILRAIDFVTYKRRVWSRHTPSTAITEVLQELEALKATLLRISEFDIETWIHEVAGAAIQGFPISQETLTHLCKVWKHSAGVYTSRVLYQFTGGASDLSPLLDGLIMERKYLEAETNVIKFLLWPIFLAGAESTRVDHREWILKILDRLWDSTLIASSKNAAFVLTTLWAKQDFKKQQPRSGEPKLWDWMTELLSLDCHWLFV